MSHSQERKTSLRVLILIAVVVGAVPGVALFRTLTESDRFFRGCKAIAGDTRSSFRIGFGYRSDGSEQRCTVMIEPVPVESAPGVPAVSPGLLNTDEVFAALTESIPGEGDEMGTEGLAVAHFLVDEAGAVQRRRIAESSGSRAMDDALLAIGPLFSFSPAETGEGPVQAWVALRVGFRTEQSALEGVR